MVFDIYALVEGLWLLLPAYAANGLAVIPQGRRPIDRGRMFRGRRLFGDGKTVEGFLFGVFAAVVVSAIQMAEFPFLPWGLSLVPLTLVPMSLPLGLLLGLGSMGGDLAGSFLKRRLGMERGRSFPLLDQEGFLLLAFLFAALMVAVKWEWVILYVVLTPVFHLLANLIGYRAGLKKQPW